MSSLALSVFIGLLSCDGRVWLLYVCFIRLVLICQVTSLKSSIFQISFKRRKSFECYLEVVFAGKDAT